MASEGFLGSPFRWMHPENSNTELWTHREARRQALIYLILIIIINLILPIKTQRPREVRLLDQSHTAREYEAGRLTPDLYS